MEYVGKYRACIPEWETKTSYSPWDFEIFRCLFFLREGFVCLLAFALLQRLFWTIASYHS